MSNRRNRAPKIFLKKTFDALDKRTRPCIVLPIKPAAPLLVCA
jgi:hypothetical protein